MVRTWLGHSLEANGWCLEHIGNTVQKRSDFYSSFLKYLTQKGGVGPKYRNGSYDKENVIEVISARTVEARDVIKTFKADLKKNDLSKVRIMQLLFSSLCSNIS